MTRRLDEYSPLGGKPCCIPYRTEVTVLLSFATQNPEAVWEERYRPSLDIGRILRPDTSDPLRRDILNKLELAVHLADRPDGHACSYPLDRSNVFEA